MVKVFKFNENDKIEFTQSELESLLNEVYNEGYYKGKNSYTWTSPYYYYTNTTNPITSINNTNPYKQLEITC